MENRNPLEVFGKKNQSLRAESASIVHTDKNGRTTAIPIASIQEVILHPPSGSFHGGIVLTTARWMAPATNVQLISLDELPYAQNIQKYILDFQANARIPATPPCELDQIAKLKTLLDSGAITESEFEAKKKQLLGL